MPSSTIFWEQICRTLKQRVGETAFEAWLKPIRPRIDEPGHQLVLEVPNDFFKEWVVQHYDLIIRELLKNSKSDLGLGYEVNSTLDRELKNTKISDRKFPVKEKIAEGAFLNPKYTFENFVVGPSNRFTNAACLSIAESPAKAYNPLFIYGKVGLGKTHLMQAICHRILERNPQSKFYYTPSEKFTNELIGAIQHKSTHAFREKFRNVDVLLIDDIHFIANKEATQEEFFHTFNALYDSHKQIIISSDRPPKEIAKLEERLVSRFGWGLVADIQPPDLETRIAILKKKVENETVQVPDDVLFFIGETIKTNIRELEGALVRVIAYSLLEDKKITLEMAKNTLKDLLRETSRQISVEDIQKAVASYYKIETKELKATKRIKNLVLSRQIAMYICRELTNLSLPEIGQFFGGKDHTTVLYSFKKIKEDISRDSQLKQAVERIMTDINSESSILK
jgi:chromosomal replication initiator protein